MKSLPVNHRTMCRGRRASTRPSAFTLIELLTVMFIITVLIGILIPSLNSARNTAKKTSTKATLNAIKIGLDLFRNDHERAFRQTNGYPPSFAHPPIPGYTFESRLGEFPFLRQEPLVAYGAHWLPMMLMGLDSQGYVKRSSVPKKQNLRQKPWLWYDEDPLKTGRQLERMPFYVDPGSVKTVLTGQVLGKPNLTLFAESDWSADDGIRSLPVIVDAFDQPILYYVANTNGRPTNMVWNERKEDNVYEDGEQKTGPPYYFHQDNLGFTGDEERAGWDFGGGAHAVARSGYELPADALTDPTKPESKATLARFILDRKLERSLQNRRQAGDPPDAATPLRPSNPDSYLLISAGADGRYGTNDDITNFPLSAEE